MSRLYRAACAAVLVLLLAACDDSKADILKKSENAATRQQLREAIGDPDDVVKVGPLETWTYKASDGSVTFTLAGDAVTLKVTGEKE